MTIHMLLYVRPPGSGLYIAGYALSFFIHIDTLSLPFLRIFKSEFLIHALIS